MQSQDFKDFLININSNTRYTQFLQCETRIKQSESLLKRKLLLWNFTPEFKFWLKSLYIVHIVQKFWLSFYKNLPSPAVYGHLFQFTYFSKYPNPW